LPSLSPKISRDLISVGLCPNCNLRSHVTFQHNCAAACGHRELSDQCSYGPWIAVLMRAQLLRILKCCTSYGKNVATTYKRYPGDKAPDSSIQTAPILNLELLSWPNNRGLILGSNRFSILLVHRSLFSTDSTTKCLNCPWSTRMYHWSLLLVKQLYYSYSPTSASELTDHSLLRYY
jgi:hypothetical protein